MSARDRVRWWRTSDGEYVVEIAGKAHTPAEARKALRSIVAASITPDVRRALRQIENDIFGRLADDLARRS